MDVENQVRGLTRHISNPSVRAQTADFLRETLAQLDAIKGMEDGHENDDYSHRDDGTPVVSIESLELKQKQRLENLSQLSLDDEDDEYGHDSNTESGVVTQVVAEIDKQHRYGYTRLMEAVVDHDIQTVKNCLAQGANRYIPDNGGNTPYEKAMKLGYEDIAVLLID